MKVLVTGGMGFIGTKLVYKLLENPDVTDIHIIDDLSNSTITYFGDKRIYFEKNAVADCWKQRRYDFIYHLAAPVGPAHVLNFAGGMADMIVHDTRKMATWAKIDHALLINISTSEVYGKNWTGDLHHEELDCIVPAETTVRMEYGVGKLLAEIALRNDARVNDLRFSSIRPFNTVGGDQNPKAGFVLPRFIAAAKQNKPIEVFWDGEQKRSFACVDDIVSGIIHVANLGGGGETYNIGNPDNIRTISGLALLVKHLVCSDSEIVFINPTTLWPTYSESYTKIPDISKIVATGWEPQITLDHIIIDAEELYMEGV